MCEQLVNAPIDEYNGHIPRQPLLPARWSCCQSRVFHHLKTSKRWDVLRNSTQLRDAVADRLRSKFACKGKRLHAVLLNSTNVTNGLLDRPPPQRTWLLPEVGQLQPCCERWRWCA